MVWAGCLYGSFTCFFTTCIAPFYGFFKSQVSLSVSFSPYPSFSHTFPPTTFFFAPETHHSFKDKPWFWETLILDYTFPYGPFYRSRFGFS